MQAYNCQERKEKSLCEGFSQAAAHTCATDDWVKWLIRFRPLDFVPIEYK